MIIPDYCYGLNNRTINPVTKMGKVIKIKALEKGFYRTTIEATQEIVNSMNVEIGVDIPTARAMEDASLWGWDRYIGSLRTHQELVEKGKDGY